MSHDFGQARNGKYECPICHKFNMSTKEVAKGKFLVNCFTPDCPKGAAWKFFFGNPETRSEPVATSRDTAAKNLWPGITLEEFARKRGFTVSQLKARGLYETTYSGPETGNVAKIIVAFPVGNYKDGAWTTTAIKLYGGTKENVKWIKGDTGKKVIFPFGLYGDFLRSDDYLVITEGEANCIALQIHGISALGISGAANWKKAYRNLPAVKNAQRIYIVQDPDEGGDTFVSKVTRDLPAIKIHIVNFDPGMDANELHQKCQEDFPAWAAVQRDLQTAFLDSPLNPENVAVFEAINENEYFSLEFGRVLAEATPLEPQPELQSFSNIQIEDIAWLWEGRIPLGMLSLIAGPKGVMKSLLGVWFAFALSRGFDFPGGAKNSLAPCDTLIFSSEDDPGLIIKPRLLAAGADVNRVQTLVFHRTKEDKNRVRQMRLDRDIEALSSSLTRNPNIKLVVIDPLASFIGARMNEEQAIRDVLCPLQDMAKQRGVAIVFIAHYNKRSDVEGLDRVLGAGAITGVCRSCWVVAEEKNEETNLPFIPRRFLLLHAKVNVAREAAGLSYTVEERSVEGVTLPVPVISWQGYTNKTLPSLEAAADGAPGRKGAPIAKALSFYREILKNGPVSVEDVDSAREDAEITERTAKRARHKLNIDRIRVLGVKCFTLPDAVVVDNEIQEEA